MIWLMQKVDEPVYQCGSQVIRGLQCNLTKYMDSRHICVSAQGFSDIWLA